MCMSTQEYAPICKHQMSTKELLEIGAGKSITLEETQIHKGQRSKQTSKQLDDGKTRKY